MKRIPQIFIGDLSPIRTSNGGVRKKREKIIAEFIHAKSSDEKIFTRNTSESLNLSKLFSGGTNHKKGDEIATTIMEHHSNFVPWQQLLIKKEGNYQIIKLDTEGELDVENLEKYISKKRKFCVLPTSQTFWGWQTILNRL